MRKLLLIACLLLTAVGMRAAKTPQVLWSEDNRTLYFINSETDYHGKAFNGYTVTKLCSGTQVTATGTNNPGWNPYRKNVKNIVFDASFADVLPTSCYSWFYDMENLVSITGIEYLNTSQVTNMAYMFNNCSKLKTLDLTHFDVSKVTTMVRMFQNSSALTTIMCNDDWYSEKVVSSTNMFGNCTSLVGAVAYSDDNSNNILYANPFTGYFSGELVPMVIYCEDNTTLYFTKCAKTIQPGKKYNGHTVTSLWKDADVTDSGQNARGLWTYEKNTTNVVIEPSFADVLPTSCAGWFVGLANLASITGLEYLNTSEVTTMSSMFSGCEALTSLDLKNFNTSKAKSMYAMFQRCDRLTSLDLTNFDTSEVTNMQYMFYGCSGLTSIDLTNVNTSKVTSMNSMFQNCQNLTSIDLTNFDTSKVTSMQYLFCGCSSLTSLDLTNFNMQNASLINSMFKECSALKTIYCDDDWKTNTINNSADLFLDCTSLVGAVAYDAKNKNDVTFANPTTGYFTTIHQVVWCDGNKTLYFISKAKTIAAGDTYNGQTVTAAWSDTEVTATGTTEPGWTAYSENVENVVFDATFVRAHPTSCAQWFTNMSHLTSITGLEYLKTSEVTTMNSMFGECRALTSLDVKTFDTQNVTDMSRLFSGCAALENLDVSSFNTGNVTDMSDMFRNCAALESLDVKNFNTSNVTNTGSMFSGCAALKTLDLTKFDMKKVTEMASMFADCKNLTTIYCNDDWNTETVTSPDNMFTGCTNLVGAVAFNADNANDVTFANPETGYFTFNGERIPSVIWCKDNGTLYFTNAIKTYAEGDTFKGQKVTDIWSGADVTASGTSTPNWVLKKDDISSIIIDKTFADVRPTSCRSWFERMKAPITGLEFLNTSEVTTMSHMFYLYKGMESLDLSTFDTRNVTDMNSMFASYNSLKSIDLSKFNTSKVTDMTTMFLKCDGLESLDLSAFETRNVTSMSEMFMDCSNLKNLNLSKFNTSKVTNMGGMFMNCGNLTSLDLSAFDTQNVTNMSSMFDGCSKLTSLDLSMFNTSKVTNMITMFNDCFALTSLDVTGFDTQNVTSMRDMFLYCRSLTSLDLSNFNTSKVTDMYRMFNQCQSLTNLNVSGFDTKNVTDMYAMFGSCHNLTTIDLSNFNTSKVTDMGSLFYTCNSLTSLDLTNFDTRNVENMNNMFMACSDLTTIYCNDDWNTGTVTSSENMFASCTNLVGAVAYSANNAKDVTFANPETGYFTFNGERIPNVIWCEGNRTLYFINATKAYAAGDTYKGQIVSGSWSGKLVTDTGADFPGWSYTRDLVYSVIIDENFYDVHPTSCQAWFDEMREVSEIKGLEYLNTSEVTNMRRMFLACHGLKSLNLKFFNTSKVTDMAYMFYECYSLTSLDVSGFDTQNVTDMSGMFQGCTGLTSLDITNFDTSKVTNMSFMLCDLGGLSSLNLTKFSTASATEMYAMFEGCTSLATIFCDDDWSQGIVTSSTRMFNKCINLSGAVAYNSKNANDITLANPKGYFTTTIHIELKDGEDNSAILDEYNGKVVSVNYDRVLKALDNGDGTWTSKAYTVCLPYDCNLIKEVRMGQILVCKLWYIKNNKEFLFSNTEPGIKAGIPYLIVVKEGEISLNAEKVVITNQVDEGEEVLEWDALLPNVLGRWKGTYHRIYDEECESQNIYGMQSDGRWERYYVTKHGPKWCWIETFRGYFLADESTGNNTYKPVYKQYVQGDDEDDPIIDFPAGAFDGDDIGGEGTGIMHVIEANGEHHYFDLQGRPLNSKPAKGVYIDNGKKIIQK